MTQFSTTDHKMMARALQLAEQGLYSTMPNPRVGCIVVQDNEGTPEIVGEGWHIRAGEAHAEIHALKEACSRAKGATVYVTLEPCSHYGRTPPCAEALAEAGVKRVVAAMLDPNPQVAGRGMERLQQAGIQVEHGLMQQQARALNAGFIKRMETGKPFVRCKLAMSLDGRTAMASGESQWITGPEARSDVQRMRARSCAVMTGSGTIQLDDAALTVRPHQLGMTDPSLAAEKQPLRVVLDSALEISPQAKILQQPENTLLITAHPEEYRIKAMRALGAEVLTCPGEMDRVDLVSVMELLGRRECNEVLLECGATLAGAALDAGLVDELVVYMAPVLMGSNARPLLELPLTHMAGKVELEITDMRAIGRDWRITARPRDAHS
ncbi:bifunctional diaminohydroxyphosphoribosylaminopyrimidine deaminase/5-amino-6-(5-phosphoribosylamino)uracil reductase RibD [Spongorhabdus nitratireducens]